MRAPTIPPLCVHCAAPKDRRGWLCPSCWKKVPAHLRTTISQGTRKKGPVWFQAWADTLAALNAADAQGVGR